MKDILLLIILIVFVWAGMILGISFLEAPLKFKAPNVTLGIGLGIGRLVFSALNRIEIIFCLCSLIILLFLKPPLNIWIFISTISFVLLVQTLWLLPVLDHRAKIIIAGGIPPGISPHLFYVAGEIVKVVTLIALGYNLMKGSLKLKEIDY